MNIKTNKQLIRNSQKDMGVLTLNDKVLLNNFITENRKLLKTLSKL